jgi:hypothetical protein
MNGKKGRYETDPRRLFLSIVHHVIVRIRLQVLLEYVNVCISLTLSLHRSTTPLFMVINIIIIDK